ncbi:unnamed protein product [Miscanthus lutarioriparius]|uniref:Uncharacterized protein n=1 Tax=Miscanthus lutarioriparius TaxID=422564 RepID=A0A811NRY1_9POAL|nr:unnamed protein product [Miscanthus lutarioriparius]
MAFSIGISPSEAAGAAGGGNSMQLPMSTTLQLRANGDDMAVSIGISPSEAAGAAGGGNSMQLQRWLCSSGLATLIMDAATAFYRSPHGVVFEQHRFAYYATLAGIFAAGLGEVGTACWLASSGQQGRGRSRPFRAGVVCASVVPLVAIIAFGGFSVVMKG